eukprot:gene56-8_t
MASIARRFDIIDRRSDIVKRFWHLRRNRKRKAFEDPKNSGVHPVIVKGHRLIQALGEHAKFRQVLTHPNILNLDVDNVANSYNSAKVSRLPKALLRHILSTRGPTNSTEDDLLLHCSAGTAAKSSGNFDEDDFEGELVLGELDEPQPLSSFPYDAKFVVAIDRVKYPTNLAMLLNTLVVLGVDCVYFVNGTCDPWNWKVLEASQGTHWSLPFLSGTAEDCIEQAKKNNLTPLVAHVGSSSSASSCAPQDVEIDKGSKGVLLVLGAEATGPCDVFLDSCKHVSVPMAELTESLNVGVAGGILAHLVQQKVLPKFDPLPVI